MYILTPRQLRNWFKFAERPIEEVIEIEKALTETKYHFETFILVHYRVGRNTNFRIEKILP